MLNSGVTSAESTPCMTYPSVNKRDEIVDKKRNLSLKTEEPLPMNLLTRMLDVHKMKHFQHLL